MLNRIGRNLWAHYLVGLNLANEVYERLVICVLLAIGSLSVLTIIMWCINAYGGIKEWNLIFFFATLIPVLFLAFLPKVQVVAMVAGAVLKGINLNNPVTGAESGLQVYYTAVRSLVLWFWVLAGFLATWPLSKSPGAFFVILAMSCFLGLLFWHYDMQSKMVRWLLIVYAITIIITALFKTLGTDEPTSATRSQSMADFGSPVTLKANGGSWSKGIRITGDRCIWFPRATQAYA